MSAPVIPLLVNTTPLGRLALSVSIEKATSPMTNAQWDAALDNNAVVEDLAGTTKFEPAGSMSLDVSDALVPFVQPDLTLAWPGAEKTAYGTYSTTPTNLTPSLVNRPGFGNAAGAPDPREPAFRVKPLGVVGLDGQSVQRPDTPTNQTVTGTTSYRTATPAQGQGFTTALPLAVGSFDLSNLDFGMQAASYVPYGAWDPATTTLVAGPDGAATKPVSVSAVPNGVDFITPAPGAVTDLVGAQMLRGSTPIDAIRVRVGGITGYSQQAIDKVAAIAAKISDMGLTATVVAGSSPQSVQVYVPDYYPRAGATTLDGATDLGWVRQDWTTLGAAPTVVHAVSGLTRWLLGLALGAAVLLTACVALTSMTGRRGQAATYRAAGWTRPRIRRFLLAEHAAGLAAVAVIGVAVAVASGGSAFVIIALGSAIAALAAAGLVSAYSATRRDRRPRSAAGRPRSVGVTTVFGVALRQLRLAPATLVVAILTTVVAGLAAAGAVAAVSAARHAAGPTRLAGLVLTSTTVGHLLLALTALAAAAALGVLAYRMDVSRRAGQWRSLRVAGWTNGTIKRLLAGQTAVASAIGLVLAVGAAWVVTDGIDSQATPAASAAAGAAILLIAALRFVTDLRPVR